MGKPVKDLVWLVGKVKTPPLSEAARVETGFLLRQFQRGERLSMPHSRRMPSVGAGCAELRVNDENRTWRIVYRVDPDRIVIAEVFDKTTGQTPQKIVDVCKARLKAYDSRR